jgi:deoxyribodipyrimidine photo-lyase
MAEEPILLWFRRDLRLADQPAVSAAVESGRPVVPVFILDDAADGVRPLGGASKWWLDKSLKSLMGDLERLGSRLIVRRGRSDAVLTDLARETGARAAVWGRSYERGAKTRDGRVRAALEAGGIAGTETGGSFLVEPGSVLNGSGEPYRVFAPWWRAAQRTLGEVRPTPAPERIRSPETWPASVPPQDWGLHPTRPDWSGGFDWTPGERAAQTRLSAFMASGASRYHQTRDLPGEDGSTRLSGHLTWGEIGARQVWTAAHAAGLGPEARDKLLSEVAWRDFNWQLMAFHPQVEDRPFRPEFAAMPFREAPAEMEAWRRGRTGYPIVDAGMRELWVTGWMPNRLRLIAGSFQVKHLLADWRLGEAWFWDTLVDADPANNPLNWQWLAGSGPDAQPFNRIFNPLLQAEKFDPDGRYVRRWLPELARLPDALVHKPWEAPPEILREAGVELGRTYPRPIVDHAEARGRALAAFSKMRDERPVHSTS